MLMKRRRRRRSRRLALGRRRGARREVLPLREAWRWSEVGGVRVRSMSLKLGK